MSRMPDYQPVLVEGLQEQIIAILQRDFADNLARINAGAGYPGIRDYHKMEQALYSNPPECLVEPTETAFTQDEQQALTAQHVFTVSIFVAGDDSEMLAQSARDYARAMLWTLARAWDYSDFYAELPITIAGVQRVTAPMPDGSVKSVEVKNIGWALKGTMGEQFGRLPVLELAIQTVEE